MTVQWPRSSSTCTRWREPGNRSGRAPCGRRAALALALTAVTLLPAIGAAADYPHAHEPIADPRQLYDGALTPDLAVNTFRNIERLFPTRRIARGGAVKALLSAPRPLAQLAFVSRGRRWDLYDYLAVNRIAGLLVLKDGGIALELYQYGNTAQTRWMSMSIAKSVTATLVGAALKQGAIGSLDDPVTKYVPQLAASAYEGVSVRDILMMSSGVSWNETYTDPASDRRRLLEAQIAQHPGAALALMAKLSRAAPPGTVYNYNTGETLIAGAIVANATHRPLADYLSERIWRRLGMESDAYWWLASPDGLEFGGSGISATLRDYGRFGLFVLGGGNVGGEALLPAGWTQEAGSPKRLKSGVTIDYGYLWWCEPPTAARPDREGAFSAQGIFGQYLYLNPKQRVVIVVWSARSKPVDMDVIDDADFFAAVTAALH